MFDAIVSPPRPTNEPVLSYAPGSPERATLKATLARMSAEPVSIPMFIGGREVETGVVNEVRAPHRRDLLLARSHMGSDEHVAQAIAAARRAHPVWSSLPWTARAAVFLKAAELAATRYRPLLNAATMVG
jgi:1-pyrroline-5-carboxylate dehydrogenase